MPPINIKVANVIALETTHIEPRLVQDIKDSLTIPNREKMDAIEQHIYGAKKMPDRIPLWYSAGPDALMLPRGYFLRLTKGLRQMGYDINFIDSMVDIPKPGDFLKAPKLRDYQAEAVNSMTYAAQGIYQAPTGSGKTVTMLALIAQLGQPTLVIVNKKEIVQQWVDRAKTFLGFEPGFIGDTRWEEKHLTIATQQTLWSKRDELDDWWSNWGMVVLDECHAVQADTYHEIMEKFPAKYRYGVSATPRKTGNFKICESVLGPIVHKTEKAPLREAGYLVTPKAYVVPTQFYYPFEGNEVSDKGRLTKRNNWSDVVEALVNDGQRNALIADTAMKMPGRCILILSKRLQQLDLLRKELSQHKKVLMLTGAEKLDERMKVYEEAALGDCIILSTLADEAVDIPRIDALILAFPTKNTDLIIQQIGRGERPHPDKEEFVILDFVDFAVGPIASQYRERKRMVYKYEDIEVGKLPLQEIE